MAAFTPNQTTTASVDDSIKLAFEQAFMIQVGNDATMDQFAARKIELNAKSIQITKYARGALDTTPLTETDDITSEAASDSQVLFVPAEYGGAFQKTSLASLQTGGMVDLALPQLVAQKAAATKNKLAIAALEASSNVRVVGGKAEGSVAGTDVLSGAELNAIYNKLSRADVPTVSDGMYIAVMHDDVIHDLRQDSGWVDVTKYQNAEKIFRNEVGSYRGFRIVKNNACSFSDQSGAGTVDLYTSSFFGARAFGLAESLPPELRITGPHDKLGRFVNVGWYGVFQYKILDADSVWTLKTASSVGNNAA